MRCLGGREVCRGARGVCKARGWGRQAFVGIRGLAVDSASHSCAASGLMAAIAGAQTTHTCCCSRVRQRGAVHLLGCSWCQTPQLTAHVSLLLLWGAGRLHVVLYEELVQHPEPVMRRLLQRCGLEWQDSVLAPHNLTRHVHTASSTQVGGWVGAWVKCDPGLVTPAVLVSTPHNAPMACTVQCWGHQYTASGEQFPTHSLLGGSASTYILVLV